MLFIPVFFFLSLQKIKFMKTIYIILLNFIAAIFMAQKSADVTLYFYNGSVLYGTSKMKDIVVTTSYGKLNIPLKDVTQIIFGLEKDENISADINKNIQILANSSDEKTIQATSESISKYGLKAIYHLQKFLEKNASSTNIENVNTLINDILLSNGVNEDYTLNDVVVLSNGDKISGDVDFKIVEFNNNFLNINIGVNKIKSMDISYFDNIDGQYTFLIKASKHIMSNNNGGWLNTKIKVKKGQTIEISATGEIVLASLDNKKYTPDGNVVGEPQNKSYEEDPASTYFNYRTLIFKIGEKERGEAIFIHFSYVVTV